MIVKVLADLSAPPIAINTLMHLQPLQYIWLIHWNLPLRSLNMKFDFFCTISLGLKASAVTSHMTPKTNQNALQRSGSARLIRSSAVAGKERLNLIMCVRIHIRSTTAALSKVV